MALALATLGSILLCAVAVALYTLLRGHSGKHEAVCDPAYFGLRRWGRRDSRQYPLQKGARLSSFCESALFILPALTPRLALGPARVGSEGPKKGRAPTDNV